MSWVFGSTYSDAYDVLYHDKNYAAECDLIERVFKSYGNSAIRSVLDLGCGTGSHAIALAQRHYEVVGVDRSESMLAQASRKAAGFAGRGGLEFQRGDICGIDLHRRFDAVLMMFAVLGYQTENADVLAALRTAHRHVRPGGLLILDVWFGPAVLHQRPSQRIKNIPIPEGQLVRIASAELDVRRHVCAVRFHLRRFEAEQLVVESEEKHFMRYFFPRELELFLDLAGFTSIRLGAFPEFDREPDETTWNVLAVARTV